MACLLAFSLCSCTGVDPNVKQKKDTSSKYSAVTSATSDSDVELEGFNAYGDGLTDSVKVKGVDVDVNAFALRSYELAFLIGTGSFKNPEKVSPDALTQYAFTHLYYDDFYKIPNDGASYKETTLDKLEAELEKYFGKLNANLKKSSLYNKSSNKFEMWLPNYGANVYYRVDAADKTGNKVEIITTFYNEMKKRTKLGRAVITVEIQNGKPVIAKLSAE
ncbi:MAG: hypothetical protein K6F88_01725 [Ruminococcus sp.]|nr:hypothetical protein [Ruminococcus sp.]